MRADRVARGGSVVRLLGRELVDLHGRPAGDGRDELVRRDGARRGELYSKYTYYHDYYYHGADREPEENAESNAAEIEED